MGWLKRHLFLAIGGLIALALLAGGTWYLLGNISRNNSAAEELNGQKQRLESLFQKDPFPHRTNIDAAKREIARVRQVIDQAKQSFKPIPYQNVSGSEFKKLLDNSLAELHEKASKASVAVPNPTYEFSFAAQKKGLKFSPASFPKINMQLAEVKMICQVLFDAKVNRLMNIKRVRASTDDPPGSPDYMDRQDSTNDLTGAVLSPYQFEFQCFSSELAAAVEGLYKSPHGMLVKALMVEASPPEKAGQGGGGNPNPLPPQNPRTPPSPPQAPVPPGPVPRARAFPPGPGGKAVAPVKEGLETILNEKLLKVILLIEVVKPGTAK